MNEYLFGSVEFDDYIFPVNLDAELQYSILEDQAQSKNAVVENPEKYHYRELKPYNSPVSYRLVSKPFGSDLSEERIDRVVVFEKETGDRLELVELDELLPHSLEEIVENTDTKSGGESRE